MEQKPLDLPISTVDSYREMLEFEAEILDLPEGESRFDFPGSVTVDVQRVKNGIMLTGQLCLQVTMDCSRCLDPIVIELQEPFRHLLSYVSLGAEYGNEWSIISRDAKEFDLAPLVRELILVGLPTKPLCRHDCRGLCSRCGANLNEGPCTCEKGQVDSRWMALSALVDQLNTKDSKE